MVRHLTEFGRHRCIPRQASSPFYYDFFYGGNQNKENSSFHISQTKRFLLLLPLLFRKSVISGSNLMWMMLLKCLEFQSTANLASIFSQGNISTSKPPKKIIVKIQQVVIWLKILQVIMIIFWGYYLPLPGHSSSITGPKGRNFSDIFMCQLIKSSSSFLTLKETKIYRGQIPLLELVFITFSRLNLMVEEI